MRDEMVEDVKEHINHLWLQYLRRVVVAEDRGEFYRVLREGLHASHFLVAKTRGLEFAGHVLPLKALDFLLRAFSSRWIAFSRRERMNAGVVCRVGGRVAEPQMGLA